MSSHTGVGAHSLLVVAVQTGQPLDGTGDPWHPRRSKEEMLSRPTTWEAKGFNPWCRQGKVTAGCEGGSAAP